MSRGKPADKELQRSQRRAMTETRAKPEASVTVV